MVFEYLWLMESSRIGNGKELQRCGIYASSSFGHSLNFTATLHETVRRLALVSFNLLSFSLVRVAILCG